MFIKFNNQTISLQLLYIGVAVKSNNRMFKADFTNISKFTATVLFSLSSDFLML